MSSSPSPRSILITGASSGIGTALAQAYAANGVTLFLSGRDKARLKAEADKSRALGASVSERTLDAADGDAMAAWINDCHLQAPLDLVIANAGISGGTAGPDLAPHGGESEAQVRRIFSVNMDGVLNTVLPAVDLMAVRDGAPGGVRGQIAIISSIAGFRGLPTAPAYSASKAAVKAYGEAIRPDLAPKGIRVNVVCPGFVTSRMTDANDFPMPFKMSAARAAEIIKKGLKQDKARIVFPWQMHLGAWLMSALPPAWIDGRLARAPKKR